MKSLNQISIENLNEAISRLGENTRLLNIAEITKDKNALLKLRMQKESLNQEIEYHRNKILSAA